jgi:hypothetical protein
MALVNSICTKNKMINVRTLLYKDISLKVSETQSEFLFAGISIILVRGEES